MSEFHEIDIATGTMSIQQRADGCQIIDCTTPLGEYARCLTERLVYWAEHDPNRILVSRRGSDGRWIKLSYSDVLKEVRALAGGLLARGLSAEKPVMILSGNSIEHLLLALACQHVGIPYSPISTPYSLISTDYGKLKHAYQVLTPGLIFADDPKAYAPAIDALDTEVEVVFDLASLRSETNDVESAYQAVTGDTIAKFLFTSGSTGLPKAVVNTQRMICANQEMIRSVFKFMQTEPPVIVDWLPWNHTFGGNHNVGLVIYNGGTLYIDDGKPTPAGIETTLTNLSEVAPSVYFNVPKGYELLVDRLEHDEAVAKHFFSRLSMTFFAGAGLSQPVWDRLDALAIKYTGKKVPMVTGLGATETAPSALFASVEECASGVVGVPAPGVQLKLVPNDEKLEVRVKAPTITPGYWRNPEQTRQAFDDEDFYCLGDALAYIDSDAPQRGFRFDGRVGEDFKLNTGTWVSVGPLRAALINAFAPLVQDVVITGHNEAYLGALVFPNLEACQAINPAIKDAKSLLGSPEVIAEFTAKLKAFDRTTTGSSTRIKALRLLDVPPSIDAHEITDKGSINQRAVLKTRSDLVDVIYQTIDDNLLIRL